MFLKGFIRSFIDSYAYSTCIITRDGVIVICNQPFVHKFGKVKNILEFLYDKMDLTSFLEMESNLKSGCRIDTMVSIRDKSNSIRVSSDMLDVPSRFINERLSSVIDKSSTVNIDGCQSIHLKISIVPYKKRFVCSIIDMTDIVKTDEALAQVAMTQLKMLSEIYPKHIINALHSHKTEGHNIARHHECVSVMFCDIVGFTSMCKQLQPSQVMTMLNAIYGEFDNASKTYNVFKLETVGDCYVAVCGLMHEDSYGVMRVSSENEAEPSKDAINLIMFARECIQKNFKSPSTHNISFRIGIHTGPVYSGLIGTRMPKYCLFGDTMNHASRMETTARAGTLQISEETYNILSDFVKSFFEKAGPVYLKGKGDVTTYTYEPSVQYTVDMENSSKKFANPLINIHDIYAASEKLVRDWSDPKAKPQSPR